MSPGRAARTDRGQGTGRGRRGTTMVEVVVAVLLLLVGALALAGGLAYGEKARDRAVAEAVARAEAESWLEAWRVAPWSAAPAAGVEAPSWGPRSGALEWAVRPVGACVQEATVEVRVGGAAVRLASRRHVGGGCAE